MPQPLGQHFLKNKKILERITQALELQNGDTIIEIGPGHGELTDEIISASLRAKRSNLRIITIEKDRKLAAALREKYRNDNRIKVIEEDALKILNCHPRESGDLERRMLNSRLRGNDIKVVGNIPYYITGKLLRILSELENKPERIVLLMQKEVAQRICAPKYNQKMNLLALSTQFYADAKILFYVAAGNFAPPPKVDSAVIEIIPRLSSLRKHVIPAKAGIQKTIYTALDSRLRGNDSDKFFEIIHYGFAKKRKFLISNLSTGLKIPKNNLEEIFKKIGIDLRSRAEDLSLENWKKMAEIL